MGSIQLPPLQPQTLLRAGGRDGKGKAEGGTQECLKAGCPFPTASFCRQLLLSLRNPCMLPHPPPLPPIDKDHQASGHGSPMTLLPLSESSSLSSPPPQPLHSLPNWREQTLGVRSGPPQGPKV